MSDLLDTALEVLSPSKETYSVQAGPRMDPITLLLTLPLQLLLLPFYLLQMLGQMNQQPVFKHIELKYDAEGNVKSITTFFEY